MDRTIYVAVEDDFGMGAAVACARRLADGRIELDGWLRADWDSALADAGALIVGYLVPRLLVGGSMVDRVPPGLAGIVEARGAAHTRPALAVLRDLALNGQVVHDERTAELDETFALALVREAPSGLFLLAKGPVHLIRAAVWALAECHRPAPVPAIH